GELNILEIPKILPTHKNDDTIVCIVVFVMGTLPNCERFENPFVALLNRQWNYAVISNFLLQKCERLLPRHFSILPQDYNIFVQSRDNSLQVLHPQTKKPLFNDFVERILNDIDNPKKVLRVVIEWDLSLKQRFLSYVVPEPILNDYSFYRKVESSDYDSKQSTISLTNLLDQFVGCESIRDWTCPNCAKSPGSMELRFHSLPDVLVFHLKRFELLSESVTKKIDSRVKIPLEKLDMSPYVYSQYSKSSTLPKNKKGGNKTFNYVEKNSMIYDLAGVIYHYGERTNSGHYTAATLNPVDGKWRIFDDSRVSTLAESVTGSSELQISSRSYLLFYQRQPYLQRKLTWFPQNVPEHIIKKYQKKEYAENVDRSYANGNSIFYKDNSDPTLKESYLKSPTKSLTQERTIPIIRETRAGPAVGYVPEFTSSYANRNF
uniref:ubiquitinyl hydrolase 1 n=1 Tax=Meloidogyne incognita TaxID=6306 RepID=A0A914MRT7_MELIC